MMNIEIERKFLIESIDKIGFDIEKYPKKRYVQAYISTSPTIRLRDEDGRYVLCVKSAGGASSLSRDELELELSKEQFDGLWKKVETGSVVKDRYFIPLDKGLTAELDIYREALDGLITVEVEFLSEADAEGFAAPDWFGRDVTYDYRYKNSSLARAPHTF